MAGLLLMAETFPLFDRELSWLSFNGRVLQEAADPRVPLYERLKFLAIYSSNLDEFFRVRVAGIRSLMSLKKEKRKKLTFDPATLLSGIYAKVDSQQEEFGRIFAILLEALRERGVLLLREDELDEQQLLFAHRYFRENVRPCIELIVLGKEEDGSFLRNRELYLVTTLRPLQGTHGEVQYACVRIPVGCAPRFVSLPATDGRHAQLFLDDLIRMNLPIMFDGYDTDDAYAIKLNRDAELHLGDEFSGDIVRKIRKALQNRETGPPARFLYDPAMPDAMLKKLRRHYGLTKEDLFPGGRYHNFHDMMSFPNPIGSDVRDADLPPLRYLPFERTRSMFDALKERNHLLHFPYMRFDPVVRLLEEAARDDGVERIAITLYRIASNSAIARALIEAATRGKKVLVFMEIKARFDEEANILWSERMTQAGVHVMYSIPGLKVHAKLYHIIRREEGKVRQYAFLGTGNFNEKTAGLYADHGFFTADKEMVREVAAVFDILARKRVGYEFEHILVAQFNLRREINARIDREIRNAKEGRPSGIMLKMNSLEDPKIIRRLYRASQAGVPVRLIIRGICCLVPGISGVSENITARSIVDRYLEHARVFAFTNGGNEELWLASADMMRRNLNRRIEVAFPLHDAALAAQVRTILDLQLCDNSKARHINAAQDNPYCQPNGEPTVQAQPATWAYLSSLPETAATQNETAPH
jgi:polyphosphate kinase